MLLQDFWVFASKFITIEEVETTVILSITSIIIISYLCWIDRYEKKLQNEKEIE